MHYPKYMWKWNQDRLIYFLVLSSGLVILIIAFFFYIPTGDKSQAPQDSGVSSAYPSQNVQPQIKYKIPEEANVVDFESLISALKSAGANASLQTEAEAAFFTPRVKVVAIDQDSLQVFEYNSEWEAKNEADMVSQDGDQVGETTIKWISSPHYFYKGKIIVLYLGENKNILELLTSLLGPQFAGK